MWYHIANEYLGKKVKLYPNVPNHKETDIEGNIPRICVSNSIYKCLRAKYGGYEYIWIGSFNNTQENPCVYFTEEEPYIPPNCTDFRANDERWFLQPRMFYYIARVDIYTLFRYNKIIPTDKIECKLPKNNKNERIYKCKEIFVNTLLKEHFV